MAYHLNAKTALWQSLARGDGIPFWRSDQWSGLPGLTHPQSQFTHPFAALFLMLSPARAAGPTLFLEALVCGAGFFVVARQLGVGRGAATFAAVCGLFQFKLIAVTYAGWLGVVATIALLPWAIAAFVLTTRRPGIGAALATGAVWVLVLHGGQLQLGYYAACLVLVLTAVDVTAVAVHGERGRALRIAATSLGGGALAAALAAYLLLPLYDDGSLVTRAHASYAFFTDHHALTVRHLLTFLRPEALGTPLDRSYPGEELWEDVAYFGWLPLVLAVLAVARGWRRPFVRSLGATALVTLLLSFDSVVLRQLWATLPGLSLFRGPSRILFLTSAAGTALAGVGLEELLRRVSGRGRPAAARCVLGAALALVGAEGVHHARRYVTTLPQSEVLPEGHLASRLAQDHEPFRVAAIGRSTLNPGWAAWWGLQLVTGFDSYNYDRYARYFDLMVSGEAGQPVARTWAAIPSLARLDLLNALNVKYLVSPFELPASMTPRFELVERFRDEPSFTLYEGLGRSDLYLYANAHARPRAWWAGKVVGSSDEETLAERVREGRLGFTTYVLGEDADSPASPSDAVTVERSAPGLLVARTEAGVARFLRTSEVWHPGWRATVDGIAAKVLLADISQMGLWVPPGQHRVELRFEPPGWTEGRAITGAAAVVFLLLGALGAVRWRRAVRDAIGPVRGPATSLTSSPSTSR